MVLRADSWWSSVSALATRVLGVGGAVTWLSKAERHAMLVESGLAHRIVHAIPEDALALGWSTTEGGRSDATKDFDASLQIEDRLLQAGAAARADGGAWLWVVVRGDTDWSQPLPEGPHEVAAVHVVTREEGHPRSWVRDLESPDYGRPELLDVTLQRDGLSSPTETVHHSRLIYIPGMRALPDQNTGSYGYDLSVLQLYLTALQDIEKGWASGASLIWRLSMPMYRSRAQGAPAANTYSWQDRLRHLASSMSSRGMMVFFGEDELTWGGPSATGYADLLRALAERLSAVEGVPLSRLLGQAPGGLSTDDAGGARTYYDLLERYRRSVLRVALLDLYRIALGPAEREIAWPALGRTGAVEQAQIEASRTSAAVALLNAGVVYPAEVRAGLASGSGPVLDPVYDQRVDDEALRLEPEDGVPLDDTGAPVGIPGNAAVQDTALNGAQVKSLVELLTSVTMRQTAPDVAALILTSAFPAIDQTRASEMVRRAAAFTPATPPAEEPPDGGAPPS